MAVCAPINPCACHPWHIQPGETLPLVIDWSVFLSTTPGYALHSVIAATLTDLNANPAAPADPAVIDTVPPIATPQPWTGDNPPVRIVSGVATEALIHVDEATPLSSVFRFDITVQLKGCDGRVLVVKDCVFVQVLLG